MYDVFLELLAEARDKAKKNVDALEIPTDGTLPPLRHHSLPPGPRSQPPLVVGDEATYLAAAPAIGPPVEA